MAAYPEPDTYFAPDLAPLVAPLEGGDGPTGPSLRYDPVFARIREARTEDDASLPMGEWTRPLKKADWRAAEVLCETVLSERSKDLQVAAWLAEAWLHRHGVRGLLAGARLLLALAEGFWDDVHPRIDGDTETRTAPLVWASEALAQTLLLHLPIVPWPDAVPPYIRLYDWQRAMAAECGGAVRFDSAPPASRAEILEQAARDPWALVALDEALIETGSAWQALAGVLDERLGADSPSLSKTADTLGQLRLAVRSLLGDRDPRGAAAPPQDLGYTPSATEDGRPPSDTPPVYMSDNLPPAGPGAALPSPDSPIASRSDAYRLLERVAEYLQRTEPHSPTPYLIRRAVTWGRLPLPELMQEVLREEGDLNRYFSMLGLRQE